MSIFLPFSTPRLLRCFERKCNIRGLVVEIHRLGYNSERSGGTEMRRKSFRALSDANERKLKNYIYI